MKVKLYSQYRESKCQIGIVDQTMWQKRVYKCDGRKIEFAHG